MCLFSTSRNSCDFAHGAFFAIEGKLLRREVSIMKKLAIFLTALTMSICSVPLAQAGEMGEILSAETRTGTIANPAQVDSFTFNGEAGQWVVIRMSRESGSLVPRISLYAPDGSSETWAWASPNVEIDHQLLQSGVYTIAVRDHYGTATGDYSLSLTKIPGTQYSPSVRIILNKNAFTTGDTLIVSAHVVNGSNPVNVEVKIWIGLPNGNQMSIFDPYFTFTVGPNANITKEIFRRTFVGNEPSGDYNVGGRLVNPVSGRELSVNVEIFSFIP